MAVSFAKPPGAKAAGTTGLSARLAGMLVSRGEVEQIFTQLSFLAKGMVGATSALDTCAETARSRLLRKALAKAADSVRGGASLEKAFREAMPWFEGEYAALIRAGEANGTLAEAFAYIASTMRRRAKIRSQIVRAATYPAIVVAASLAVGWYASAVAIPKVAAMMPDPSRLPAVTRSLLAASALIRENGVWFVAAPVCAIAAWRLARKIPAAGEALDRIALFFPLSGKVARYASAAAVLHTLGAMIAGGLAATEAITLAEGSAANLYFKKCVRAAHGQIAAGKSFSEAFRLSGLARLAPVAPALVKSGENAGSLAESLKYAGNCYTEALERRLDALSRFVEPALIAVVGAIVAYVYIAFFMGMAAATAAAR